MNKLSNGAGYWRNIHESIAFQYTNKHAEKKIMDTLPFTISSKKTKYVGIGLITEVKDLYTKNFRPLKRQTPENQKTVQACGLVE